ncbi:DsbA family protein [Pseudonocardia acaciae]|uniref:mycothiol-dependent nitroreductase Rv2466c family protein n=1 Tax=Pseudonocardia acaciae TaxID=551276 RepID=UPI00048D0FAC|nr:DsbA family protein [Pseudonocardia acaciae]
MADVQVDFHFDPMCPFAYHTSRWLREVRARLGIDVRWRFFSLEEVNRAEGKKHPWQRPWSYGWSLMRIGVLLRRRDMALLDAWYRLTGSTLHEHGGKPHDPEVARRLLTEIGVEPTLLDQALDDPSTHEEIKAEHRKVVEHGGFGVPTLFVSGPGLSGEQCLFGPVLMDPPSGAAAERLWRAVTGLLEFPHVYELQRPKSAADQALIADRLQPYLRGRDWVSINRGEIVEFPESKAGVTS